MGWCSRCRRDVGMLSKHHGRNPACREAFLTEDTVAPLSLPGPLDLPLRKGIIQLDMADNRLGRASSQLISQAVCASSTLLRVDVSGNGLPVLASTEVAMACAQRGARAVL